MGRRQILPALLLLALACGAAARTPLLTRKSFPKGFVFGTGSAAYQYEGAVHEGGRGPTVWDKFAHTPGKIADGNNGDVALDFYHKYKEDLKLVKDMNMDAFSHSLSSLPYLYSRKGDREAIFVPSFSAAGAGGSPPLRSPLRRREGGGTADLSARRVNSRSLASAGGAVGVEAASGGIMVRVRLPLYAGVPRSCGVTRRGFGALRSSDLGSCCFPRVDAVAAPASALFGVFVPPLWRRRASFCGGSGRWRWSIRVSFSGVFSVWPWWQREFELELLDPFLDGAVVVVALCGVFAPAGRGGEGSGRRGSGCAGRLVWLLRGWREDRRSVDAGTWLCSFIDLGVRRGAAAGVAAFFNVGGACFPGHGGTAFAGGS